MLGALLLHMNSMAGSSAGLDGWTGDEVASIPAVFGKTSFPFTTRVKIKESSLTIGGKSAKSILAKLAKLRDFLTMPPMLSTYDPFVL